MRDDPQYPARDDVWSDDDSRVVGVLRTMTAADEQLEDLPPGLWERISGQLESSDQPTVIDGPPQLRVVGPTVDATPDVAHRSRSASGGTAGGDLASIHRQRAPPG